MLMSAHLACVISPVVECIAFPVAFWDGSSRSESLGAQMAQAVCSSWLQSSPNPQGLLVKSWATLVNNSLRKRPDLARRRWLEWLHVQPESARLHLALTKEICFARMSQAQTTQQP